MSFVPPPADTWSSIIVAEAVRRIRTAPDGEALAVFTEGVGAIRVAAEARMAAVDGSGRSVEWRQEQRDAAKGAAGGQVTAARTEFAQFGARHGRLEERLRLAPLEQFRARMSAPEFAARVGFIWASFDWTFRNASPKEQQVLLANLDPEVSAAVLFAPRSGAFAELDEGQRDLQLRNLLDAEQAQAWDAWLAYRSALEDANSILTMTENWLDGLGGGAGAPVPPPQIESVESVIARTTHAAGAA